MATRFDVTAPDWTEFEDQRVGTTFDASSTLRTEFEAVEGTASAAPSITNGPFTAAPGEQITLQGENLDTVDSVTYAGSAVAIDSQTATSLTFTVPDAFDNGLGFGFTHFIVVDNGAADATTQNTLQAPADAHANGEVSGYDSLGSGEYSWFDDSVISVVDGDYWITFNPNNLTNLTTNADGTSSSDDTGDFTGRVLDTSDNTDGPDGTWTESLTVSISSSGVTINPTVADTFVDAPDPVVTIGSALDPQERTGEQRITIEVQSGETIVSVGSNSVTPQVGSNTITLQIEDNTVTAE